MGSVFKYIADVASDAGKDSVPCPLCGAEENVYSFYAEVVVDGQLGPVPISEACVACIQTIPFEEISEWITERGLHGLVAATSVDKPERIADKVRSFAQEFRRTPRLPAFVHDDEWPFCCGDLVEFVGAVDATEYIGEDGETSMMSNCNYFVSRLRYAAAVWAMMIPAASAQAADREALDRKVQAVIDEVDKTCRDKTVYMIGPKKAKRLAELVRQKKPKVVVECGTAIGYSGLWIARELKATGRGKLITIEIGENRSKQARENFRRAGLEQVVDARVGDARKLVREIEEPVDFLFIDCNYANYHPCLAGIEHQLTDGAVVVADNVGIGAAGMKDYLDHVRSKYRSKTEWFNIDLPWGDRDAMEITIIEKKGH